jgi:hypothetical protein
MSSLAAGPGKTLGFSQSQRSGFAQKVLPEPPASLQFASRGGLQEKGSQKFCESFALLDD